MEGGGEEIFKEKKIEKKKKSRRKSKKTINYESHDLTHYAPRIYLFDLVEYYVLSVYRTNFTNNDGILPYMRPFVRQRMEFRR